MKNILKLFGIIAIVALIGFSMTACGDDGGDGGNSIPAALVGTWGYSGNDPQQIFIINANGSGTFGNTANAQNVTWSATSNKLTLTMNGSACTFDWAIQEGKLRLSNPTGALAASVGTVITTHMNTLGPYEHLSASGTGPGTGSDGTQTYIGMSGWTEWVLKITGDAYVLTTGSYTSTGSVGDKQGTTYYLKPSVTATAFTATVTTAGLVELQGTIVWYAGGTPERLPGQLTPVGGPGNPTQIVVLTYNANGGSMEGNSIQYGSSSIQLSYPSGTVVTVGKGEFGVWRTGGYKLMNWNTAPNGNGTTYEDGDTFTINGNMTLYAMWWAVQ